MTTEYSSSSLIDLLPVYYARVFPFDEYCRWLSYGNADFFSRREFSFTLENDVYIRYNSFANKKELEIELRRLNPLKIDIGAVYNVCPKQEKSSLKFTPLERELVFDIDLTDYDDLRICCSGTDVCQKCWKYVSIACKILDDALREDFGFKHLLWVFSGRRGVHCWVCDERARVLKKHVRVAIANYLTLVTGGEFSTKKVNLNKDRIHHSVKRAVKTIESLFVEMSVVEQDMLGTEKRLEKFLPLVPESMQANVKRLFEQHTTSLARWEAFVKCYEDSVQATPSLRKRSAHLLEEIMLQYAYPRLDVNVTMGVNHLLKSPFCIHPKTGKVCIPFSPGTVSRFDPCKVPTINVLIEEINAFDAKEKGAQDASASIRIKDYKKTSLNKSLYLFNEFLRNLESSQRKRKIDQSDMSMEF